MTNEFPIRVERQVKMKAALHETFPKKECLFHFLVICIQCLALEPQAGNLLNVFNGGNPVLFKTKVLFIPFYEGATIE